MQIVLKVLVGVMLIILALVALLPKSEKSVLNRDRPSIPHTYYYYPKANFYYDSTDGKYICWDSSGSAWKKSSELPLQQDDLGKRVRIGQAPEPVWQENEHHRLIYSVSLYSGPKDFKIEKKTAVKPAKSNDTVNDEQVQKKSAVKKFLERIFPPKNKKDG
jgi:hypothetical protein